MSVNADNMHACYQWQSVSVNADSMHAIKGKVCLLMLTACMLSNAKCVC